MRRFAAAALMLLIVGLPAKAGQARGTQGSSFDLNTDDLGVHTTDSPEVLDPLRLSLGLIYDNARDSLVPGRTIFRESFKALRRSQTVNFVGAVGLPFRTSLGLHLPLTLESAGEHLFRRGQEIDSYGLGDIRVDFKWQALLCPEGLWSAGLKVFSTLPTGSSSAYRSENGHASLGALILAEGRVGLFRGLFEFGYQWLDGDQKIASTKIDDRLLFGLAVETLLLSYRSKTQSRREIEAARRRAEIERAGTAQPGSFSENWDRRDPLPEGLEVYELAFRVSLDGSTRAEAPGKTRTMPIEVLASLVFRMSQGLSAEVGAGKGLGNGLGAPDERVFFGLRFSFGEPRIVSGRFARKTLDLESSTETDWRARRSG